MKSKAGLAVLVATGVLVSCQQFEKRSLEGLTVEAATTRPGAAAYLLKRCPVNPSDGQEMAVAAIAVGALAPLLANLAVTVTEDLLKAEQEGLSGQFVAGTASTGLYDEAGNLSFGCIAIVRGLFGATEPSDTSGDNALAPSHLISLSLADYPAFYLEAEAKIDGTSLILEPRYIRYAQSSARRMGSGMKNVGLVLALSEPVLEPDAKTDPSDKKTTALYRFNLGRLEIGKSYKHTKEQPLLEGTAAQQTVPEFGENQARTPFNVLAIVTETEEPGLLLKALTSSFAGKKGDLEKALVEIIKGAFPQETDASK